MRYCVLECWLHYDVTLHHHHGGTSSRSDLFEDRTLLTLDSANRPGTLVELVQVNTDTSLPTSQDHQCVSV